MRSLSIISAFFALLAIQAMGAPLEIPMPIAVGHYHLSLKTANSEHYTSVLCNNADLPLSVHSVLMFGERAFPSKTLSKPLTEMLYRMTSGNSLNAKTFR